MSVQLNFNAATVAPQQALDPMPSGWYNAMIEKSSVEPTTKGGQMLAFELRVLDGPHAGRKLYDRLNIVNDNPTAVQIAYETLSAVCHATGVIQCDQSAQLHNIPMKVKVKLQAAEKGKDGKDYDARNEVKGYDNVNSAHDTVTAIVPGIAGAPAGVPAWAAGAPVAAVAPVAPAIPAYTPPGPAFVPPAASNSFAPPVAAPSPIAAPLPVAAAPVAPVAAPAPPAPAPVPAAAPVGPVMLPAANGASYQAFIDQGWTEQAMIEAGYMAAPIAAPWARG